MKLNEFRKIIREEIKAAIQEELKDILLEAVRSPKPPVSSGNNYVSVTEATQPRKLTSEERRAMFSGILGEMQQGGMATTAYAGEFNPKNTLPGGDLPTGEVSTDQIMQLMNKK